MIDTGLEVFLFMRNALFKILLIKALRNLMSFLLEYLNKKLCEVQINYAF